MQSGSPVRETIPFVHQRVPFRIVYHQDVVLPGAGMFGYHPELEIQFVRRGSMIYTVRDSRYVLRPNSLLVIYPNEIHTSRPEQPGTAVTKITVLFKPAFAGLPLSGEIVGHANCRHMRLTAAEAGTLARIATDLQAEADERPAEWMALCRLKINELVVMVKRAACRPLQAEISNPLVAHVLDIVDAHFAGPIANESLARAVGISTSRLMHLFTEHMGQGIKQYVLQLRILKACETLLAEPGLKIESVAQTVGFRYVADFNRAFKTHTRLTPAEYRIAHPNQHLHFPLRLSGKRSAR